MEPRAYGPFPYTPITERPEIKWPGGARIALWVAPLMLWMTSRAIELQIGPIFFIALLVYVVRAVVGRPSPTT